MTKFIVLLIIFILGTSCRGDPQRDVIIFKNKTEEVRDSIVVMNSLMDKLDFPKKTGRIKSWFFINDSIIDINGDRHNFNRSKPEQFTVLHNLPSQKEFLNLISYFRDNGMTSCQRDCSMSYSACGYYYSYRYVGSEPNDLRFIVLEKPIYSKENSNIKDDFKVLDQKSGIALLALKDR